MKEFFFSSLLSKKPSLTFDVILILILQELDDEDHSNEQGNMINQRTTPPPSPDISTGRACNLSKQDPPGRLQIQGGGEGGGKINIFDLSSFL